MEVNKPVGGVPRTDAQRVPANPVQATPSSDEPAAPVRRVDDVEISIEGRALAGGQNADAALAAELGDVRVQTIRTNVATGAYLTTAHADYAARAILSRGDL
jgi:hypothetical protein